MGHSSVTARASHARMSRASTLSIRRSATSCSRTRARDLGGLLHRLATSRLPHTKREERANLIERESHRLRAANEHDATDRVRSVFTVAACRAVASAQQAAPLVVPERLHAHARRLSDGPDAQRDFHTM